MSDTSSRSKMFEYDWWHPLTWIAGISFAAAVVSIIILAFHPNLSSVAFLSSILTLIASSLISHLVTYSNERKQFSRHLAKFSAFAKRRVDILCTDLNLLSIEIVETADLKEAKQIVLYALKNLEQDAKASVRDIDDMRRIDEDDDYDQSPSLTKPMAKSLSDFSGQVASTEEKVVYSCPRCGYSNTASLSVSTGSTKQLECANCRAPLNLHRLARGATRVVVQGPRYLGRYITPPPQPSVVPSNGENSSAPAGSFPSFASGGANDAQVQDSFHCPRCQHRIRFSAPADQRIIERPCFSCLSVVAYDRRDRIARVLSNRKPNYVEKLDDTAEMTCVTCQNKFIPRIFVSVDGKQMVCCFSCNTIYLPVAYRKKVIEKNCPSYGCNNMIGFKIDETSSESRQFCFECMSRLAYHRDADEVSILEKLKIPQVMTAEFEATGKLCPHCQSITSGRYTMNSRKQKLSICWNCKNVFELIDSPSVVALRRADVR